MNALWRDLNRLLDTETMDALTAEEVQWIAGKEQAVKQAGAEYEGGSIQSMVKNQKAAELTEARVYELMELLRSK